MRDNHSFPGAMRLKYKFALGALLILASAISVILEKLRIHFNGSEDMANLIFNLGLAWIPLGAAVLAYIARHNRLTFYIVMPICGLIWFIFFPNAPYLLTDFQHLAKSSGDLPLWVEVIVLIWFAWTGLLLGITSLFLIQEIVTDAFSPFIGWIFAIGATILSSFGIFLGRFLRWNSWDLLYDPIPIAKDMADIVRNPIANLPTYIFTILFTLLFLFIYLTIHLFGSIIHERAKKESVG